MSAEDPAHRPPDYSTFSSEIIEQMEQFTGIPAETLVIRSDILQTSPVYLLDNAAGAGVVTAKLFGHLGNVRNDDVKVVVGDLEPKMNQLASERFGEKVEEWGLEIKTVDSLKIDFPDNTFTHVLTNFGIQLFPDQKQAIQEMYRVLKPGGVVGFTTWNRPGWVDPLIRGTPDWKIPPLLTGVWATASAIPAEFEGTGFTKVEVTPCDFDIEIPDVDKMCDQLLGTMKAVFNAENIEPTKAEMKKVTNGKGIPTTHWKSLIVTAAKPKV